MLKSSELALKLKPTKGNIAAMRRHELAVSTIEAMGNNPQLPWIVILLGGLGTAGGIEAVKALKNIVVPLGSGESMNDTNSAEMPALTEEQVAALARETGGLPFQILEVLTAPVRLPIEGATKLVAGWADGSTKKPESWLDFALTGVEAIALSVSAFAAIILILMVIFGGSKGDEGGSGVTSMLGLVGL